MKKNTLMRIASVLLVVVLATTCVISGTFAKYVTSSNGGDTARVAQWGIVMDSTGVSTFLDTYSTDVATNNKADNFTNLVAPGTAGSSTYQVTGTPETDYIIDFQGTALTEEVFLGAGTYTYANAENPATSNQVYDAAMTQTVTERYNPVKYYITVATTLGTLNDESEFTANTESAAYATLAEALADLAATTISFDANEACDVVVTVRWDWVFEGQNDAYDTILGDLEAGNADLADGEAVEGTDWNLDIVYNVKMTATQVNAA